VTFFYFGSAGVRTQDFLFARQALYQMSHTSVSFCPGGGKISSFSQARLDLALFYDIHFYWVDRCIPQNAAFLPELKWNCDHSNFSLLCSLGWDDGHTPQCPAFDWDGVFKSSWWPSFKPQSFQSQMSASQVARITGVFHQCPVSKDIFRKSL
jgi:hypothetical protein